MKYLRHQPSFFLLCLSLASVTAGAGDVPDDALTPSIISNLEARKNEIVRKIKAEIGDPIAGNPSDCRVLPFGEKPCGGPASYVVFSSTVSNIQTMQQLTTDLIDVEKQLNRALHLASDCSIQRPPDATIVNGRCSAPEEK